MNAETAKDHPPSSSASGESVDSNIPAEPGTVEPVFQATQPTAEPVPADSAPSESELERAQAKAAENHDRYLRTLAEFDNFRRRTIREKEELRQYAASKVLEDLLPALDNLSHGLAAAEDPKASVLSLLEGMKMVSDQILASLAKHGLKQINPVGEVFDHNFHEALTQQASAEIPEGNVVQVVRVGYTLNGRLLRAASVIVSSGPASEA